MNSLTLDAGPTEAVARLKDGTVTFGLSVERALLPLASQGFDFDLQVTVRGGNVRVQTVTLYKGAKWKDR